MVEYAWSTVDPHPCLLDGLANCLWIHSSFLLDYEHILVDSGVARRNQSNVFLIFFTNSKRFRNTCIMNVFETTRLFFGLLHACMFLAIFYRNTLCFFCSVHMFAQYLCLLFFCCFFVWYGGYICQIFNILLLFFLHVSIFGQNFNFYDFYVFSLYCVPVKCYFSTFFPIPFLLHKF